MHLVRRWSWKKLGVKVHKTATVGKNSIFLGLNTVGAFAHLNGDIEIGLGTSIGRACILHGSIKFGRYTQVGPNVGLFSRNHSMNGLTPYQGSALFEKELKKNSSNKPIVVGHSSWIGRGATILSGVNIGNHVIVGAGSVVTSDLPDFSVAVGNPARIKKYKYTEKLRAAITASNWWEKDPEDLEAFKEDFLGDIALKTKLLGKEI